MDELKKACFIAGASEYPGPYNGSAFLTELLGAADAGAGAAEGDAAAGPAAEAGGAAEGGRFAGRKVLVAGATAEAVESVVERLGGEGAETESTAAGPEVLTKAVVFVPDLILMEVLMEEQETVHLPGAPRCEHCGKRMTYKGGKKRGVGSWVGEVKMERSHYYCPDCKAGFFPSG